MMVPMSADHDRADARARELAHHWRSSVVLWWDDDRRPRVLAGPGAHPLPGGAGPVHVLTPQDPQGITPTAEENARLLRELLAAATAAVAEADAAWRWWPAMGASSSDDHAEHGIVVVGLDRRAAARWGEELDQLAIYEVTAEELRVVRCRDAAITDVTSRAWPDDAPSVDLGPARLAGWWAPLAEALPEARPGGSADGPGAATPPRS